MFKTTGLRLLETRVVLTLSVNDEIKSNRKNTDPLLLPCPAFLHCIYLNQKS